MSPAGGRPRPIERAVVPWQNEAEPAAAPAAAGNFMRERNRRMERLFFDVDGVLLNFEHAFVAWLNVHYRLRPPGDYQTPTWYFDDILPGAQGKEAWTAFLESPDAGRMKPYLEAARFNALTAGRPVHLLTNFPENHFDKRMENLALLGFRYASMHHCGFP